jgi:hypothetical protein
MTRDDITKSQSFEITRVNIMATLAPSTDWRDFRVSVNQSLNGFEIRFPVSPPEQICKFIGKTLIFSRTNDDPRWWCRQSQEAWSAIVDFTRQYGDTSLLPAVNMNDLPETSQTATTRRKGGGGKRKAATSSVPKSVPKPTPRTESNVVPIGSAKSSKPKSSYIQPSIFDWMDNLLAATQEELERDGRRQAAIAASLEFAKLRAENPYSWNLFAIRLGTMIVVTASLLIIGRQLEQQETESGAIACEPEIEPEPGLEAEQEEIVSEPVTLAPPTPHSAPPASEPAHRKALKREKIALIGEPRLLRGDELRETEGYPFCYGELDGVLGLSTRGLKKAVPIVLSKTERFTIQPGLFYPVTVTYEQRSLIGWLIRLHDCLQRQIELERDPSALDAEIEAKRVRLNALYRAYTIEWGFISQTVDHLKIGNIFDARFNQLKALDRDGKLAVIFRDRVHYPILPALTKCYEEADAETLQAALQRSISSYGEINLDAIGAWFGITPDCAAELLVQHGLAFVEPE